MLLISDDPELSGMCPGPGVEPHISDQPCVEPHTPGYQAQSQ